MDLTHLIFLFVFLLHLHNTKRTGDKQRPKRGFKSGMCICMDWQATSQQQAWRCECSRLLAQGVGVGARKVFSHLWSLSLVVEHLRSSCSRMCDNRKRHMEIHGGMWGLTWKTGSIHGGEGSRYRIRDLVYQRKQFLVNYLKVY